eukprot:CCRYP_009681-RA/>CCRYP_009681-RA protein AED:0.41 eAED:0.41 QI:0/0/0/0.5/1/1/2/0/78
MAEVNLVPIPDYEVLDKLLILWDTNATECIDPNFGKDEDTVVYADAVVYGDALFKVAVHPSTIEFAWGFNTARYGTAQ